MTTTESPVLAKLGPCCITGYKHTGDPTGTVIQLGGMDTYLAEPPAGTQGPKKVLLFISDVHGSMYLNAKLLQDNFATYVKLLVTVCEYLHTHPYAQARSITS